MKTVTVKFPDELAVRLEKRAVRLGTTKSALIRESVEKAMAGGDGDEADPSFFDLVKGDLGCVDSGIGDLSTNPRHMEGFGK